NCLASFREIGCYRDTKKRALPKMLLNKRGKIPNFWQNYDKVLPSIICDCAKEAERKGYRVFGIQFYGECWGSHSFIPSHRYRPVRRCIDEQFKTCAKNGWNSTCTGKNWANFIYKLQQYGWGPRPRAPLLPPLKSPNVARRGIKNCSFPIDIALAIDASGSVGNRSFQLVREFLKLFTQHFDVSHMVRFACLHYDHFVYKDFSFKDEQFRNRTNLEEKLQNMSYPSGATLTHQALIEVIKFFGIGNGARNASEVRRVAVVLTDGRTYGGKRKLIPPVDYLKKYQHVIIVPIGVGWAVSREELQVMAGDRRHYVLVDNFDKLANAMYEVLDLVCTW
ncbi:unnamed protein product, partial [Porites evermanni]